MTRREQWRALYDGVGHLHTGREPRSACGIEAIGEQFSWPVKRQCLECLAKKATSSLPEELLMAGYGVRPIGG